MAFGLIASSGRRAAWVYLVVGMSLAAAGAWTANRYEIGQNLEMDLKGTRVQGWAEPMEGAVRLSYTDAQGAIRARYYNKPLAVAVLGRTPLELVVSPSDAAHFQPAGLSYVPAAGAFSLFALGMAGILRARRLFLRPSDSATASTAK